MTDFSSARASGSLSFTYRETWEVVVVHVSLACFFSDAVDSLCFACRSQSTYGHNLSLTSLEQTGTVDRSVWNSIQSTYYNILSGINYEFREGATLPYPGRVLFIGATGEDVRALQEYLNYLSGVYTEIPKITVDGDFGDATERAVIAFNRLFDIPGDNTRVTAQTWKTLTSVYEDLYIGNIVREGQYPGYVIE